MEDMIEVGVVAPTALQLKQIKINTFLKDCVIATKIQALFAKTGESSTTTGATLSQWATKKTTTTRSGQIKVLTNLVRSLLKLMDKQKQTHAD
jgi:hypothetical protein